MKKYIVFIILIIVCSCENIQLNSYSKEDIDAKLGRIEALASAPNKVDTVLHYSTVFHYDSMFVSSKDTIYNIQEYPEYCTIKFEPRTNSRRANSLQLQRLLFTFRAIEDSVYKTSFPVFTEMDSNRWKIIIADSGKNLVQMDFMPREMITLKDGKRIMIYKDNK